MPYDIVDITLLLNKAYVIEFITVLVCGILT